MARVDRKRLEEGVFPHVVQIETRYADLDRQGHVNNVAAAALLQDARTLFDIAGGLRPLMGAARQVVAGFAIEYAGEMGFPGTLEVRSGILEMGRSSILMGQLGRFDGRTTLYAECVLVLTDANGPAAMPAVLREAYERLTIG
jgi:acyl-CoA thioester hydrolase